MKTKFFLCECTSFDHLFSVNCDDQDCYIAVHLSPKSFFQRVIGAFKYIFGFRSRYGDFEEIMIKKEDAKEIAELLKSYAENKDS